MEVDEKGTKTVMVSLYPKLAQDDDEDIYTEMIFIVDRSGSMAGSRMQQVKDTLHIFLRSLGEGTQFNIIGFGSRTQHLFPSGSVEYNDKCVRHTRRTRRTRHIRHTSTTAKRVFFTSGTWNWRPSTLIRCSLIWAGPTSSSR